jgi:succinate-acetate transporter protein
MIHSVEDAQLEKHRNACLDASQNLLKIYHIMRSDTFPAFSMIKLIDYQAFVCSALLILGLLGYGSSTQYTENQEKDRYLIRLAIFTLRQASGTVNNPIAAQAVQGLQTLMLLDQGECSHKQELHVGIPL